MTHTVTVERERNRFAPDGRYGEWMYVERFDGRHVKSGYIGRDRDHAWNVGQSIAHTYGATFVYDPTENA